MEDSVRKVEFFYFGEILELHLEKRLLIDAQIFGLHLNGNSGRSDGDYLWSTWVFVRVANMIGGGGWVVPRWMLIPDVWMRRHPALTLAWKFPGDGSSPWQHSASKYVWWSDTHNTGRMNCEQLAPNCLSFPEHSLNIVYKDAFPPPDNWTELLWSQRCR